MDVLDWSIKVPVIDATEPIIFVVKTTDVKGAKIRNPEHCVAARGVLRVLDDGALGVKIGATIARVHYGNHIKRYFLSKETKQMIKAYDAANFYPTGVTVKLQPPAPSNKIGSKSMKPKGKNTGTHSNLVTKSPWLRHIDQG